MLERERTLVAGFPGFRARKLVAQLLDEASDSLVYVVVRDEDAAAASAALLGLPDWQRGRVIELAGDPSSMDLGLSGQEYRELTAQITRIHHVAQLAYPGTSREDAEAANVGGARELVELGRSCTSLRSIVYHSSASVSGKRRGVVFERELEANQDFHSDVDETLARAERVVRLAMHDLPIAVLRPTSIVGDSRTGEVDERDGIYVLLLLLVSAPQDFPLLLPARGDTLMNLVPIDYVVRAACHVGRCSAALGRTLHLRDPRPLSVRRVFELVARSAGKRLSGGYIPTRVSQAVLGVPGLRNVAKRPRALLDTLATPVTYDDRNAVELLNGTNIECPAFDSYVDRVVAHVKRRVDQRGNSESEVEDSLA